MELILVKIQKAEDFDKVKEVVSNTVFTTYNDKLVEMGTNVVKMNDKNDWRFLQMYFFVRGNFRVSNFTHFGITNDGDVFPTTLDEDSRKPSTLVVDINQLSDKINLLKVKGDSLTSDEVIKIVKEYKENPAGAALLRNAIRFNRNEAEAAIIIPVIDAILESGFGNLYNGPLTMLVCWDWKESIRVKYTPEPATKSQLDFKLIGGRNEKHYEKEEPVTYAEIVALVSTFATTDNDMMPTWVQIRLTRALSHRYGKNSVLEVILGCMLIDGGRRRNNVLQYVPVINLLLNGVMGQSLTVAAGEIIELD